MALLSKITLPVHVILCGAPSDTTQALQPHYLEIAQRTGGSLHTVEDDLLPENLQASTWINIAGRYYRYSKRKEGFVPNRFKYRPKRFMGVFWL